MQRKTNSNQPADWLFFARSEMEGIHQLAASEVSYWMCCSKLAEALEKILKAELLRLGWFLEKTHDLQRLADELIDRGSDLDVQSMVEDLAESYFVCRYPGFDLDEPDWEKLRSQIKAVEEVMQKVCSRLGTNKKNTD